MRWQSHFWRDLANDRRPYRTISKIVDRPKGARIRDQSEFLLQVSVSRWSPWALYLRTAGRKCSAAKRSLFCLSFGGGLYHLKNSHLFLSRVIGWRRNLSSSLEHPRSRLEMNLLFCRKVPVAIRHAIRCWLSLTCPTHKVHATLGLKIRNFSLGFPERGCSTQIAIQWGHHVVFSHGQGVTRTGFALND